MGKTIGNQNPLMNERNLYDRSCYSMICGDMGKLQTIKRFYVCAGDSVKMNFKGVFRLSPLRRTMYLDAQIDLFAFYVPHRQVYGSSWATFIKDGVNESTTFGTRTLTGASYCFATHSAAGATVPKHIPEGYVAIYNNYFKRPTAADYAVSVFDAKADGHSDLLTGLPIGHLPRIWNTTIDALTVAADRRIALVDTDKIDLVTFAEKQGTFESLLQSEWFSRRYRDVIQNKFGAFVNTDADARPTLLMHQSSWLSGSDVDGTDDASLGTSVGKANSVGQMQIPWKFIPEHGVIWVMAAVRFPPMHNKEVHYLDLKVEPTYMEISGDPEAWRRKAPVTLNLAEYFLDATDNDAGKIPYGQWLREEPHYVHKCYADVAGHPFLSTAFTNSGGQTDYCDHTDYDDNFSTLQLRHWQAQCNIGCLVKSLVPLPTSSIFAGVN